MKKLLCLSIVCVLSLAFGMRTPAKKSTNPSWSLKGSWTDTCCCKITCPCLFGSKPTEGFCEGASLLEIESGHYGDVSLDNTVVVTTYKVKKWSKFYVSDAATQEQAEAIRALLPEAMLFLKKSPLKKLEMTSIDVARDGETIRFSVPETTVEMVPVKGSNGEPIKLHNLPAEGTPFPSLHEHTQYKAKKAVHKSTDDSFKWEGRNAFSSIVDLSSDR
jgi:hypothetical protein